MSQELNEERTSFEREVLSKNEKIADLKERLQEKKSETAIELRYLAKESKGTCGHIYCVSAVWMQCRNCLLWMSGCCFELL